MLLWSSHLDKSASIPRGLQAPSEKTIIKATINMSNDNDMFVKFFRYFYLSSSPLFFRYPQLVLASHSPPGRLQFILEKAFFWYWGCLVGQQSLDEACSKIGFKWCASCALGCFRKTLFSKNKLAEPTTHQVSVRKSEGFVKMYNVKMVRTEMARGPPKLCRNQKSFWILSK